ncbi:SDR family NAD(P)-dependent oxidoreductase, partial [Acinetobacter sp. UBA1297]
MIADLNLEAAQQTAEYIKEQTGGDIRSIACNILKDSELVGAVESTLEAFGHIHILVNNAGGGGGG